MQVLGSKIDYAVPADLSLEGKRTNGYFVIGERRWAYVEAGIVHEWREISAATGYKVIPLIGNAVLEADEHGEKRIVVRLSMKHAARYAYIAKVLNDLSSGEPVRIYNDEPEPICVRCGGHRPGTKFCRHCVNKTEAILKLFGLAKGYWLPLALAFVLLIAGSVVFASRTLFSKLLVNGALQPPAGQRPDMVMFAIGVVGLVVDSSADIR